MRKCFILTGQLIVSWMTIVWVSMLCRCCILPACRLGYDPLLAQLVVAILSMEIVSCSFVVVFSLLLFLFETNLCRNLCDRPHKKIAWI